MEAGTMSMSTFSVLFYLAVVTGHSCWACGNNLYSCGLSSPCQNSNYTYSDCYRSCYMVVNTPAIYLDALMTCVRDGAHLFVPNKYGELSFVMNMTDVATTQQYWIGLQDWARRGAGRPIGTWNVSSGYQVDPDGIWYWMDDSPENISSSSFYPKIFGPFNGYASASASYLPWKTVPVAGIDFITYLEYVSANWAVSTGRDFVTSKPFICEHSVACATCPPGWFKYLGNCYFFRQTQVTYYQAVANCATAQPPGVVWTPRTEATLIFSRIATTNLINAVTWIGLAKSNTTSVWQWADDLSMIAPSDPFDAGPVHPGSYDIAFVSAPDSAPNSQVHFPLDGFSSLVGWGGVSQINTNRWTSFYVCQVARTSHLYLVTTTAAPTTITTTTTMKTVEATTTEQSTMSTLKSTPSTQPPQSTTVPTTAFMPVKATQCKPTVCSTSPSVSTSVMSRFIETTTVAPSHQLRLTTQASCGNGVYQPDLGEQCDDKNTFNGDGCASDCTLERVNRTLDIYFAVDSSGEVPFTQFGKLRTFIQTIINQLDLKSPSNSGAAGLVQVGIFVFGGRTSGYRLLNFRQSSQMQKADIIDATNKMAYFSNPGNLSNALDRLSDSNTFSNNDGSRVGSSLPVTFILSSSASDTVQHSDDNLSKLGDYARRLLLVSIGGKIKGKQLSRFSVFGFATLEVRHWDQLQATAHRVINFLLTVI